MTILRRAPSPRPGKTTRVPLFAVLAAVVDQDEPNGRHCDNENCLMYFAVRTTDFIANLLSDVPELDQNCLDDLQANGGS